MKKVILSIFLLFSLIPSFSQDLPCKSQYYDKKCKERYLEDSEGQINGKYILYNEDGKVKLVAYYSHGKYNGTVTEFYGWGKIVATYLNGTENGLYQKTETDGTVLEKGTYTNGNQTGYWIESGGTDKGNYVNGKKNGVWEIFFDGFDNDGGIVKANYTNGIRTGTWTNVVVYGRYSYQNKTIVVPSKSDMYTDLELFYKQGYKVVLDNGKYIQGFDANGIDLETSNKLKIAEEKKARLKEDSISNALKTKQLLAKLSLGFYADSYLTSNGGYNNLSTVFPENKILFDNKPIKIIIVGHTKPTTTPLSEDEALAFYILSLNRAIAVKQNISKLINNPNVTIECIGVGNAITPAYNPDNGMIQVFINEVDSETAKIYNQFKTKYPISSSDNIINNYALLKIKLWNIYMNFYGTDRDEILSEIPEEFKQDDQGNNVINPHIQKAISDLPGFKYKIQNDQITKEAYQKQITELLSKINQENFK